MYTEHADFELFDRNAVIWRYLTLSKFTDLLQSQEVFFARANILRDKSEGVWSWPEVHHFLKSRGAHTSQAANIITTTEQISLHHSKSVAVNCWCLGEHERSHMWDNYVDGDDGVAIATTVQDLTSAFDRESDQSIHIGEVKYIDYQKERMYAHSSLAPFVFKSREFEGERELRAVTTPMIVNPDLKLNVPEADIYPGATIDGKGIRVPVHLDRLIKTIRVAPFASKQCEELVDAIVGYYLPERRYAIEKSQLYSRRQLPATLPGFESGLVQGAT